MDGFTFTNIVKKYKKCPNCGASYKTVDLQASLDNDIITISCKCGWQKKVDENNKEIIGLKPCPFCGEDAKIETGKIELCSCCGEFDTYFVSCSSCSCKVGWYMEKEDVIKEWNNRV